MVDHAVKAFGFDADAFVFELTDSIIGDNYPVPDRMLVHAEQIAHRYLMWAMCGDKRPIRQVRPVCGRRRHCRHVLHLQVADRRTASSRRATPLPSARQSSRPTSRSQNWRTMRSRPSTSRRSRSTGSSIPTKRSRSLRIRRSRHSSSSTPAIRRRWRSMPRR